MRKSILMLAIWLGLFPAALLAYNYVTPGQFIGNNTLVSFWRSDCSDCQKQVTILISLARLNPNIHISIVTLKGNGSAQLPDALPATVRVFSVDDAATSLRAFGASQDMLPFNALLDINGSVCKSHAGVQGQATFEDWVKQC